MDLDQRINAWVAPVADAVTRAIFVSVPVAGAAVPLIVVWLIAAALFFTVYFGFANVTGFRHAVRLVAGRYDRPGAPGDISHFRSLATALSATVGIGNIAGVAIAISLGGPGATFWMILAGFFGMSSKFAECALAVRFRRTSADGTIAGGPMYYLREGFARYGRPRAGRALAALFALCCVVGSLGIGNMFQGNQAVQIVAGLLEARGVAVAGFDWLMGLALPSRSGWSSSAASTGSRE